MFLRHIFIFIIISIEFIYAQSITISIQNRFVPFIKKIEKNQSSYKFKIQKRNSSFDAFRDVEKGKASLAIIRGDILVDNSSKKIKIISKLKLPTFLHLVSKDGVNNAYDLLNSDEKKEGVKYISVGYLNDLANVYLKDIAKNVYSQYSFRYKYFSPKESFQKLKEDKIDAGYLFLSPLEVKKAKKMGFKLQKIVKAKNRVNLSKKLEEQKAFTMESNGIRVDNYLVASSSISKKLLKSLLISLKKQNILVTRVNSEYGKVDSRIKGLSKEIDKEIKIAKECSNAKLKRVKLFSKKKKFNISKQNLIKKMKLLQISLKSFHNMGNLKKSLAKINSSIKRLDKEFLTILKKVQSRELRCNVSKTTKYLKQLDSKISQLNRNRSKLKKIKKKILKEKKERIRKEKIKVEKTVIKEEPIIRKEKPIIKIEPLPETKPNLSLEREDRGYREF